MPLPTLLHMGHFVFFPTFILETHRSQQLMCPHGTNTMSALLSIQHTHSPTLSCTLLSVTTRVAVCLTSRTHSSSAVATSCSTYSTSRSSWRATGVPEIESRRCSNRPSFINLVRFRFFGANIGVPGVRGVHGVAIPCVAIPSGRGEPNRGVIGGGDRPPDIAGLEPGVIVSLAQGLTTTVAVKSDSNIYYSAPVLFKLLRKVLWAFLDLAPTASGCANCQRLRQRLRQLPTVIGAPDAASPARRSMRSRAAARPSPTHTAQPTARGTPHTRTRPRPPPPTSPRATASYIGPARGPLVAFFVAVPHSREGHRLVYRASTWGH